MTAKAPPVYRVCPNCEREFQLRKPSKEQKFCGHACAAAANYSKTVPALLSPEARKKHADARRGRGKGASYIKRDGRHEHRVVAEHKIGRALARGEIVHHRDENKRNNSPDNLEVLPSQSEHSRLHNAGVKRAPKMVCKRGHPLTEDNVRVNWGGFRGCLTCYRAYDREYQKERRRQKAAQRQNGAAQ